MREVLIEIIKDISSEKKAKNLFPAYALYTEISTRLHQKVGETLNELIKEGKVSWHKTLNDKAFELTEEKDA